MAEKYIHYGDNSTVYPDLPEIGRDLCRVKRYEGEYGGYRIDILTENLSEREKIGFVCTKCEGIMKGACTSSSGEQFCSCCRYIDWYNQEIPSVPVRKMINTLNCCCPLIERGCEWLGTLEDCEDHLDTCGYVHVSCKLTCGVVLRRDELKKHANECLYRQVKCGHCKKDFKSCELNIHLNKCPKMKVPCDLCGTQITREDIPQHLKYDCGMVQETCKLGCGVKLTRNKLKIHENDTCVQRKVGCEHCYNGVKFCDYPKHLRECPNVKVSCDICDIGMMYRKDMTEHLKDYCPENEIECPFVKYKCMTRIRRKDMDNHLEEKETKHLGLKLTAMEDLISKQSEKISKQSEKITKQNEEITKQSEEIGKGKRHIEMLYSISDVTTLIWKIENVTNKTTYFESVSTKYRATEYTFSFRLHYTRLSIVFPGTTFKPVNPFVAKCHIALSSSGNVIKCGKIEIKQKDITKGCEKDLTSIPKQDIDRYSQPRSPGSITKDLTLEIYLTMQ